MDEAKRPGRAWVLTAVAVLLVVTALRCLYLTRLQGGGVFIKYIWFADEILAGRLHRDRLADLSPLYLWVITFLRWIGLSEWPTRFLQVTAISGAAACAATAAWRFGGRIAAVGAAVIVLANRAALVNATDFEPETLLLLLEAVAIALLVSRSEGSRRQSLLAGLAIGLAIIARPVALLTAIVLAGYLIWKSRAFPWLFAAMAAIPVVIILAVNTRLTGDTVIMDPGTVFYEGMNPRAIGCTGVLPRIVSDLEPSFHGPDTLHVAYRFVASRATGNPRITRGESNRWWARHALAYVRYAPSRALKLTLHKLGSALERHDYYDVMSMDILARSMTAPMWIPWSAVFALALAGLILVRREAMLTFGGLAIAAGLPMLIFFVTARHRNPLLIPAAVLAGLAVEAIWRGLRARSRTHILAATAVVALTAILSLATARSQADDYSSQSFLQVRAANAAMEQARQRGDTRTVELAQAYRRTWNPEVAGIPDHRVLEGVARTELARATDTQRLFRIGIALDDSGAGTDARRVLQAVDEEDPQPTEKLPPPSFYIARSLARSGELAEARQWLTRAGQIAPGNADTLALGALLDADRGAATALSELHDPFTAALASAEARLAVCRDPTCTAAVLNDLRKLGETIPPWSRPAQVAADELARH